MTFVSVLFSIPFQTTEDVKKALSDWYEFECRGTVKVKGKGEMTTYWLIGRKEAAGLPNPKPPQAGQGAQSPKQSQSKQPNSPRGDRTKGHGFFDRQASSESAKSGSKVDGKQPKQCGSNTGCASGTLSNSPRNNNLENNSIEIVAENSKALTQSPTASLKSPRSPTELVRAYDQEHAQKIDMQMSMPTPPGSLSRRRNNIDSPRDSRNPLRKLSNNSLTNCISSQGPPSEASSTYMRVDSPELPAVHFRNVKMNEGDERNSRAIQNDLFDSLKVGLEVKHTEKHLKHKKKKDVNRTVSNPLDGESSRMSLNNEIPPPLPMKNRDSFGYPHYDSVTPAKTHNYNHNHHFQNKCPSEHGRPIVPYQVSNPVVPMMQETPLVQAGVSNPILGLVKPAPCQSPRSVNPPNNFFFHNNHTNHALKCELASIDEIPPEERRKRSNVLKELGTIVNPLQPNRPVLKSIQKQNSVPEEAMYSVINKLKKPEDACEEKFVTAVYREPIAASASPHISPIPTPPLKEIYNKQSTTSNTQSQTPNSFDSSLNHVEQEKPLTRLPPRPTPPDTRRISDGSHHSSNSSQSTLTPTSLNPVVASIDGKMMSLLPPPPESQDNEEEEKLISLLKRSPSDSTKDKSRHRKSVPQVKRSNSSPRARPRGFPVVMKNRNEPNHMSSFSDDDESVASHQQSESSSVVLLQPIELKLARPAYVRQISNPDHHVKSFLTNSDFSYPYRSRHLSRSSDTINSIPRGQQTPKFPLMTAESTSLTQLLKELANDHPSLDLNLNSNLLNENESDLDSDDESRIKGFTEYEPLINGANSDFDNVKDIGAINRKSSKGSEKSKKISKAKGNQRDKNIMNPYQVKRRNNYTIPPRYCRSLDYIPSDREDHNASNQSSTCGSPKSKHDLQAMHAYMLPFFSGRNPLGIDSISVSSIESGSEMSRSDPALNVEVGSSAYESEYDNYRPGMTSDEDYFHPDPVSDMDIDLFDDVNVDNVTVSDSYSFELPPLPVFPQKRITEV